MSIALPTSSGDLRRAVETGEPISPEKRSEFASQIKNWASTLVPAEAAPNGNQTQICVLELTGRGRRASRIDAMAESVLNIAVLPRLADGAEGSGLPDALQRGARSEVQLSIAN